MEKSPNATWKAAKRERYIQYLGGKCIDCGSTEKLEFDHVDPSARFSTPLCTSQFSLFRYAVFTIR